MLHGVEKVRRGLYPQSTPCHQLGFLKYEMLGQGEGGGSGEQGMDIQRLEKIGTKESRGSLTGREEVAEARSPEAVCVGITNPLKESQSAPFT